MQHKAAPHATIEPATSGAGRRAFRRLDASVAGAELDRNGRAPCAGVIAMRIALLFVVALSAGCALQDFTRQRITHQSVSITYSPSAFSAFAAAGPLVEIRGAPPGGAGPAAVLPALRLPAGWPQTPFRLVEPAAAAKSTRIVLAFGVPGGVSDALLCRGDYQPTQTAALTAAAAWCRGRSGGTAAKLTDDRPLGPDDPAFATAMTRLFDAISPRRDPANDNDRELIILAP